MITVSIASLMAIKEDLYCFIAANFLPRSIVAKTVF